MDFAEAMIRKIKPDCIINSRIRGCTFPEEVPPPYCDYISSGDNEIFERGIDFEWENPGSMNSSYAYNKHDHNWLTSKQVIARLVNIVSKQKEPRCVRVPPDRSSE